LKTLWITLGLATTVAASTACGDDEGGSTSGDGGSGGAGTTTSASSSGTSVGSTSASSAGGGGAGPSSSGSTGGAPGSCDEGFACVPAHQSARQYFSVGARSCGGATYEDVISTCDVDACSCDAPTGTCEVSVYLATDDECTDFVAEAPEGCTDVADDDAYLYALVGGDCADTQIPITDFVGCAMDDVDATACEGGGVCMPEAAAEQYCIAVPLGEDCPDEVYTLALPAFFGGDAECTCSCFGDGECDDPTVTVSRDDDACGGTTEDIQTTFGGCEPGGEVHSIEVASVASSSESCGVGDAYVSGGTTNSTLCCMP
jgi:hypothetical protein